MSRFVPYDAERRRLLRDLEAAFDPDVFERAYGRVYKGIRVPDAVSIGGDASNPPFEVIVWEFPRNVSNEHRTTPCPLITSSFDIVVGVIASGPTRLEASAIADVYVDCVMQVCMADPTLGGLVDHVHPTPSDVGGGSDGTYGFTYGTAVYVSCRRDIPLNKVIRRAVQEAA